MSERPTPTQLITQRNVLPRYPYEFALGKDRKRREAILHKIQQLMQSA